jgi:hypothetical protein
MVLDIFFTLQLPLPYFTAGITALMLIVANTAFESEGPAALGAFAVGVIVFLLQLSLVTRTIISKFAALPSSIVTPLYVSMVRAPQPGSIRQSRYLCAQVSYFGLWPLFPTMFLLLRLGQVNPVEWSIVHGAADVVSKGLLAVALLVVRERLEDLGVYHYCLSSKALRERVIAKLAAASAERSSSARVHPAEEQ